MDIEVLEAYKGADENRKESLELNQSRHGLGTNSPSCEPLPEPQPKPQNSNI